LEVKNRRASKTFREKAVYSSAFNPSSIRGVERYMKQVPDIHMKYRLQTRQATSHVSGIGWALYSKPSLIKPSPMQGILPVVGPEGHFGHLLLQSLSNIRVRISLYISIVAAFAIANVSLIVLQSIPSAIAIPILGGLLATAFISCAFVFLLIKEVKP
jgi:hypothetical protein